MPTWTKCGTLIITRHSVSGISILSSVLNHLAARFHFTRSACARFSSLALLSSLQFGNRNLWRFGYYSRFAFRMSTCLLTINLEYENRYTSHPFLQNNTRARRSSRNQTILRYECFKNYLHSKTGGKVALPILMCIGPCIILKTEE